MKIALVMENSQAAKNAIVEGALKRTVEPLPEIKEILD